MNKQFMHFAGMIIWIFLPFMGIAQNSVLSEGTWYKLSVSETGIYKITYNDLLNWGIDPGSVVPENISIYGNGNGMLPESTAAFRYDDLQQNAIHVEGEADGTFDPGDFILFYGEGPTDWHFDEASGLMVHSTNIYSDAVCYFLTTDATDPLRIQTQYSSIVPPNNTSTTYTSVYVYEPETENLIHSGKIWFGDKFDIETSKTYPVNFPGLLVDQPIHLLLRLAARSSELSTLFIYQDEFLLNSININYVNFQNPASTYARMIEPALDFNANESAFDLILDYNKPNDSSIAWLDYFTLQAICDLKFEGPQMAFRDLLSIGPSMVTEFLLEESPGDLQIWNVTNPLQPQNLAFELIDSKASFILETDSLLSFIAFTNADMTPEMIGMVENQNLHGLEPPEMVIISAPEFLSSANALAGFRESNDNLSVFVTTPDNIYHEFSSGAQDVTAIRDFMRYLHEKSGNEQPKYLLLLGDGSVDYKDRLDNNTNFVPVWESEESLNPISSYCMDDFYGRFSDDYSLSIAVGRLPAGNIPEAEVMVQKLFQYESPEKFGSWRNDICFIADDEDGNLHLSGAEELANTIILEDRDFNIQKIYLDAFPQIILPDGQPRYPEVNQSINSAVNDGLLVMTYIGHGGPEKLAYEEVLTPEEINTWTNTGKFPVMLNYTGDISRFDNPAMAPLGEQLVEKENAGMVAVMAPSRPTYAGANLELAKAMYRNWLDHPGMPIGEIAVHAKNESNAIVNKAKHILFGDPSMRIAVPLLQVKTESIKGIPVEEFTDTLHPGSFITLDGYILSEEGNLVSGFNGELTIQVYDRSEIRTTLGNDTSIYITDFEVQDKVIKSVSTEVINGHWESEFFLPNELDSTFGNIKLSYYAWSETEDAAGHYSDIVVGGLQASVSDHDQGKIAIQVYPTFADDRLFFQVGEDCQNVKCELINLSGIHFDLLKGENYPRGTSGELDVSDLPAGFYILTISANGLMKSQKVIIR
jgi:hypothetical protein